VQFYILFNTFLVMLSCFLQWIQPKIFVTNIKGIETFDGKIIFGLGIIGFLAVSYDLITRKKRFTWITGIVGFIVFIITSMLFYNYSQYEYVLGPGMYLAALGSVQLTGSYVVFLFRKEGQPSNGKAAN